MRRYVPFVCAITTGSAIGWGIADLIVCAPRLMAVILMLGLYLALAWRCLPLLAWCFRKLNPGFRGLSRIHTGLAVLLMAVILPYMLGAVFVVALPALSVMGLVLFLSGMDLLCAGFHRLNRVSTQINRWLAQEIPL